MIEGEHRCPRGQSYPQRADHVALFADPQADSRRQGRLESACHRQCRRGDNRRHDDQTQLQAQGSWQVADEEARRAGCLHRHRAAVAGDGADPRIVEHRADTDDRSVPKKESGPTGVAGHGGLEKTPSGQCQDPPEKCRDHQQAREASRISSAGGAELGKKRSGAGRVEGGDRPSREEILEKYDTNGDGELDEAERAVLEAIEAVNPEAEIVTARSDLFLDGPSIGDKRVVVVEDGPTLTGFEIGEEEDDESDAPSPTARQSSTMVTSPS